MESAPLIHKMEPYFVCQEFTFNEKKYEITIAYNKDLRFMSYQFMYENYLQNGLGSPHPSNLWYSLAELLPYSVTTILLQEGQVIGSVTSVVDSQAGLPVDDVFCDTVNDHRLTGKKMAEIISLGLKADKSESRMLLSKLFNFVTMINYYVFQLTHLVITVMPKHAPFYERHLLFENSGLEGFHDKTGVSCRLLHFELERHIDAKTAAAKTFYRNFMPYAEELPIIETLKKLIQPISKEDFTYFLHLRPEIRANAKAKGKEYIETMLRG
ncbi:hypothetical protein GTO91_09785 [Heliobacterium undosum]|uniref:N-acyl amino acid synthase FeeM catalytic core domain-containing protein n=1 Tax=Heliomicrobium undosum TaxID=121734 RepID=A0A845L569_9FIRM|nr:hypothetical protein [Heliomicrobium undosum]MZP29994.1 hypothetical protein [Heliomicrobium undosum]